MTTTMRGLGAGAAAMGILGTLAMSQMALGAATQTASLSVTATVAAKCTIAAPNTLAFGDYDPLVDHASSSLDSSATLSVACTKGAPDVWVGLGTGSNNRQMSNGSDLLQYELYADAGRSSVWGDSSATGVSYSAASKAPQALTVYGRVPAGQDVGAGSYSDSVVATINF